jgi:hypothetical protein
MAYRFYDSMHADSLTMGSDKIMAEKQNRAPRRDDSPGHKFRSGRKKQKSRLAPAFS